MTTLLVAEHDNKSLKDSTNKALSAAKAIASQEGVAIVDASKGILGVADYPLLAAYAISQFVSMRLAATPAADQQQKTMQQMMVIFPFIMPFFLRTWPSAFTTSARGMSRTAQSRPSRTTSATASSRVSPTRPVSWDPSDSATSTLRPRARRKCFSLVSGRSTPGELTSSV